MNLSIAQMETDIVGHTLVFYDGGQARFSAGGSYSSTYKGSASAFGTYRLAADSTICIDYRNGFKRCDRYVRNSTTLVLLAEDGERFPVHP